jgi:hypothetical protein
VNYIIQAASSSTNKRAVIPVTHELKRQLYFWLIMLRATSGHASIPEPAGYMPPWATKYFTDAAGGSTNSVGHGSGGVGPDCWFFVPWPGRINKGVRAADGKKLSRKMSALELVGPLVAVASAVSTYRNKPVVIWVDNIGSVRKWEKGYSTRCELCTTLVKAIATVAAGLGCRLDIRKITRCSVPAADALSKADFGRFRRLAGGLPAEPLWAPRSILAWIQNPVRNDHLGDEVLRELRQRTLVLGYNC